MSAEQQQKLDSLYAIDNVLTIKITMPQGDWDAVRTEQPKGGRCNFEWTGGARYTWRKATSVEISGTSFPARTTFTEVGVKKKSFCGSSTATSLACTLTSGSSEMRPFPRIETLIGTRYITLNNSIQDPVIYPAAAGLQVACDGRIAPFALQFRPGVREWNAGRPRGRWRQQPGYLRQRRTDHEALHRAQFQRQHAGQPVRNRASR